MSKILVTGGLGTVGSPLVSELESRGHDVWIADQPWTDREKYYQCNIGEYRQLAPLFETHDFDYVYHLAAKFGRKNGEDFYESMWKANAVGTKHMIRLQEEHDFRMIFSSSSEIYGDYQDVMNEELPLESGVRQHNDYAISKWVNEQQILNSEDRHGTETVRVRLFNNYGPGEEYSEYRSVVCKFCYLALSEEGYHVYENHKRPFTYIDDTIRTLANISDNFKPGNAYNIANDTVYSVKQLSDTVLDCLGKSDDDIGVEYRGNEDHNTVTKNPSIEKARQDLDHRLETSLEEGIEHTVEWMRQQYDFE